MSHEVPCSPSPTRRTVLTGACGVACGVALTACSGYGSGSSGAPAGDGGPLIATGEVPVGGGVVLAERGVVVTQPQAGTFQAFSAQCTHQGCTVIEVADGTINCPCHGSRFALADGSVVTGPAREALPVQQIAVEGESVSPA